MIVLGIESSCDETGAAVVDSEKGLLSQAIHTQIDMHRAYGGVVPELASRDHIRRSIALIDQVVRDAGITKKIFPQWPSPKVPGWPVLFW